MAAAAAARPCASQLLASARRPQQLQLGGEAARRRRQGVVTRASLPEPSSQGSEPDGEAAPGGGGAASEDDVPSLLRGLEETIQSGFNGVRADIKQVRADIKQVQAAQATQAKTIGVLCEKAVRAERVLTQQDPKLRPTVEVRTGDALLDWCSVPGSRASRVPLLRFVGPDGPAPGKLFGAVAAPMQEEAAGLGVSLPVIPSAPSLHDHMQWLSKSKKILLAARPKGRGTPAWRPACEDLEAYFEAAGSSADGSSLLAFLERKEQGRLVLMLLCACATGRLYERVELDAEPLVEVTSEGVKLDLLEIKAQPSAIKDAVRQLQAQANILLLALAASNAALLQRGPVHVVGTVAVAASVPTQKQKEYWERVRLVVGGVGPAPKATMQLQIQH